MSIFYFQNDLNRVSFNIEAKDCKDIKININGNYDDMKCKRGVHYYKLNQENPLFYGGAVHKVDFISSQTSQEPMTISIFNNYDLLYLNNIKFNNGKITVPLKTNLKKPIERLGIYIESIFYNWYFYIISYILVIVYFTLYKNKFDFKIKYPVFLILTLALLLRISHIGFIPFWDDELYTFGMISDGGSAVNLNRTILDPGNPPLFFILSNIWLYFFHSSDSVMRILPVIIDTVGVYLLYYVLKQLLDKKTALIASFLASINIYMIMSSNEIRCYSLAMSLVLLGEYYFIKLKYDFSKRNLAAYAIFSMLLVNCHYYCILFVIMNFISGIYILKKNILKFSIANFLIFLSFLPYFVLTTIHKSFNEEFNSWIPHPNLLILKSHIWFYFGNILFFILTIAFCFCIYKKFKEKEKFIFLYNIYIIFGVFILALLISLLIKPILFEKYLCIFLPLFIINTAIILSNQTKPVLFVLIFLFSINMPKYENFNLFNNINNEMNYAAFEFQKYQKEDLYIIMPDYLEYHKYFKNIPKDKLILYRKGTTENADLIKYALSKIKSNKNIIIYSSEITANSKIRESKNTNIKKIITTSMPIYKIFVIK